MASGQAEKLPRDDPVLLVCAPHCNQFLDPVNVLYQLPTDFYSRGRKLGFIVAAKSLRRRLVGFYARLMDGIPVERPQDLMVVGSGTVRLSAGGGGTGGGPVLVGEGTLFRAESNAGDAIVIKCEHQVRSRGLTATVPVESPCCSCRLTASGRCPPTRGRSTRSRWR